MEAAFQRLINFVESGYKVPDTGKDPNAQVDIPGSCEWIRWQMDAYAYVSQSFSIFIKSLHRCVYNLCTKNEGKSCGTTSQQVSWISWCPPRLTARTGGCGTMNFAFFWHTLTWEKTLPQAWTSCSPAPTTPGCCEPSSTSLIRIESPHVSTAQLPNYPSIESS